MPPVESPAPAATDTATTPQPDIGGALDDAAVASAPAPASDPPLGEAGERALHAEREARKEAEKAKRAAERERDALLQEKETEQEKLQREAAEGRTKAEAATAKLRKANLVAALADLGIPKVKAAVRLLDGVEFDDDDEPTNLEARIEAAKAEFGEELFGETPSGDGEPRSEKPSLPDTHAGARPIQPQADEDAQYAAYMAHHFPQTVAGRSDTP